MNEIVGNLLLGYCTVAVLWILIVGAAGALDSDAGRIDATKRKTFWAVTGLVWPLVVLWGIWRMFRLIAIEAYQGYKLIREG